MESNLYRSAVSTPDLFPAFSIPGSWASPIENLSSTVVEGDYAVAVVVSSPFGPALPSPIEAVSLPAGGGLLLTFFEDATWLVEPGATYNIYFGPFVDDETYPNLLASLTYAQIVNKVLIDDQTIDYDPTPDPDNGFGPLTVLIKSNGINYTTWPYDKKVKTDQVRSLAYKLPTEVIASDIYTTCNLDVVLNINGDSMSRGTATLIPFYKMKSDPEMWTQGDSIMVEEGGDVGRAGGRIQRFSLETDQCPMKIVLAQKTDRVASVDLHYSFA